MENPIYFQLERRGATVALWSGGHELFFEVDNPALLTDDASFAAWALLPVAMASGRDIVIEGAGDAVVEKNAETLTRYWSLWAPRLFRPAFVTFAAHRKPERSESDRDLVLFSGGVDSTYNLLRRKQDGSRQTLLTLRGLDYRVDADAQFRRMIEKTDPVAHATGSARLFAATNAYEFYKSHGANNVGLTHGFVLASALFLLGRGFRCGEIAADYARHQEFIVAPWGTNSVSNDMFESSAFKMRTACLDVTRAQKMATLLSSPEALSSLSFCNNREHRPDNCGVCAKCVRTKYMFLAATGRIPEIFMDMSVRPDLLGTIDVRKRSERAFFLDLVSSAEEHGTKSLIPGLEEHRKALFQKPSPLKKFARRQWNSVRKCINYSKARSTRAG